MTTPAFIITIDTEGDNLFQNHHITTKNARFLPRFQRLCEKYCFKPVYLTNYEMTIDDAFIDFARDLIARDSAEIGMHLHAWNSPPSYDLTGNDGRYKPYLIEYPQAIMQEKILFMTKHLEDTFQKKMLSHRAGRWAFNECYAHMLLALGYQVDCSVTPRVDWRHSPGSPTGSGGSNYRHFPDHAYFIDLNNIVRPGNSKLLEVPMTTRDKHSPWMNAISQSYDRLRGKKRGPSVQWLRPTGDNAIKMCQIAEKSLASGSDYIEFMLHSFELMPGGSPVAKNTADIEKLYRDLEHLFDWVQQRAIGITLAQYYQQRLHQLM
uniref:Putative lipid A core:surface polymer ligase n=1 Tax=Candidatus Steffania adelgidicola str. Klausen-Leopoldsdorf TaxID=994478 RepID=G3ADR6_9GAMM|nr:putative lipid A core:surface polymer ligase [Candidatus Steffania adelgidicola str. Klausen-Leopoldsdorf]